MIGVREMYLMFQDRKVLQFHQEDYTGIKLLERDFLPYYLKDGFVGDCLDGEYVGEQVQLLKNSMLLVNWLSNRILSLDRKHVKKILALYDFPVDDDILIRAKISMECRAVSILDCYWLKDEKEKIVWDEVNLRKISLSNFVFHVALKGNSLTIQKRLLTMQESSLQISTPERNPEFGTFGTYAKAWRREGEELYLYKTGEREEVEIEASVSKILDCFNVSYLEYELVDLDDLVCTRCKCMAAEEYSMVSAKDVKRYYDRIGNFIQMVIERFGSDFFKMCQVDYLIANTDRHLQNWGFYMDNRTMELIGLHPLYDHNNAFDKMSIYNEDLSYLPIGKISMKEAAMIGAKQVRMILQKPIRKSFFWNEEHYMVLKKRILQLGIQCKIDSAGIYPVDVG